MDQASAIRDCCSFVLDVVEQGIVQIQSTIIDPSHQGDSEIIEGLLLKADRIVFIYLFIYN